MSQRITVVDAFTDRPFAGNPAAICLLNDPATESWMQDVAREMNLSETAFLVPKQGDWSLRWFTPEGEVELCGHATLASSHFLWEEGHLDPDDEARFHTLSGLLTARRKDKWIEMDFPATPAEEAEAPAALIEALGAKPVFTGRSTFDYLVEFEDEQTVLDLNPNLTQIETISTRGVLATARAADGSPQDFVSRCFFPAMGIPEDPVTGSAHCALGPHWGPRLGKTEMVAYQASRRGGTVRVRLDSDRIILGGQAVTVLQNELIVG